MSLAKPLIDGIIKYGILIPAGLPLSLARAGGTALGDLAWRLDRHHRRVGLRTLEAAIPEFDRSTRARIVRQSFRHFGSVSGEFLRLGRETPEALCRRLEFEDWQFFARAEAAGRGVLVLTAHLGFHELLAPVVALYKGPMQMVARPIGNAPLHDRVKEIRTRFGNGLIPKRGAARGLLKAMTTRGRAAILIDQRVHPHEGVEVPFFGLSSWTSPLPAQISVRTGAPVLPLLALQVPGGRNRIVARAPIFPADESSSVRGLTARYTAVVEEEIRARPQQWLWMHDRWKRR